MLAWWARIEPSWRRFIGILINKYINHLFSVGTWDCLSLEDRLIRLADKPWQKVLLTDLLREKNTARWLTANKLKRTRWTGLVDFFDQ